MKIFSVLLMLIFAVFLHRVMPAAQAIDRSLVCENVSFTVNNVGKRAILVVDVRYRPSWAAVGGNFPTRGTASSSLAGRLDGNAR